MAGCVGGKARLESHNLVKVCFDAGDGDAYDHLGGLARDDETLSTGCNKGRVVRDDGGVHDLDA